MSAAVAPASTSLTPITGIGVVLYGAPEGFTLRPQGPGKYNEFRSHGTVSIQILFTTCYLIMIYLFLDYGKLYDCFCDLDGCISNKYT